MTFRRSERSGRAWIGSIVLLVVGMAFGALSYAWFGANSSSEKAPRTAADTQAAHEDAEEGVVRIPLEAQKGSGLEVQQAVLRKIQTTLRVTGTVAPDQTRVAHIRPLARGVVEEVFVQLGDRVQKGDPLVSYDNIELGFAVGEYLSAKADLRSTQTTLDVKQTILARSREMLEVGAIARTTHDVREAEYRDAQAQVSSMQARVAKFEEQLHRFGLTDEDLKRLNEDDGSGYHRTSSHSTLRAPSAGIITTYDVTNGETIDPSSALLTITDISTVWVQADVYEQDLSAVHIGKPVDIRVAAYPRETFRGPITYISDVVEPETRTARVRCVVANPRARLKLDMFATVEIPTEQTSQVLAVPVEAVQRIDDQAVVFVRLSEVEFEQRPVAIGAEAEGWVEIHQGVEAGELVISEGSFYAKTAALRELIGDEH